MTNIKKRKKEKQESKNMLKMNVKDYNKIRKDPGLRKKEG